jgi:hypothetical protein
MTRRQVAPWAQLAIKAAVALSAKNAGVHQQKRYENGDKP